MHVRIHDFKENPDTDDAPSKLQPASLKKHGIQGRSDAKHRYISVDFIICDYGDGTYSVIRWSISGFQRLSTRESRFPLQTYERAAIYAVGDAVAADDLTYDDIDMVQELQLQGSLTQGGPLRHVYAEYKIVDGRFKHPRILKRPRPGRRNTTAKSEEARSRVSRAAEEYRRALESGSRSPTADVARALTVGRSTAARALTAAREQGLLGPALRNRAGEQQT
jgi:hypothetical protein